MLVQFTIPGPPVGKGRPRFARMKAKDGRDFVRTYSPKETDRYENKVSLAYRQVHAGPPAEGPVKLQVCAYFPIPQSWSNKKKEYAKLNQIPVTVKPDIDNICKVLLDGLNGIAFADDKQVFSLTCHKFYSDIPRTVVAITEVLPL